MQDFESELVPLGGDIPHVVKAPPNGSDSGSKDCVNLPSPDAVFRIIRRFALPASYVIILACAGCYPNRAVIDPWSYAPLSPSKSWVPPKNVKPMPLSDEPPDLPGQEEPYSLGELIDIALRNNQQTKITWAQARSAAASYGQSQSQFFPAASGNFSFS